MGRFQYNTDTWAEVGIGTKTMTGSVLEIKAFEASGTVATHNTTTNVMTLSSVVGNLREAGQLTILDDSEANEPYVFSYDTMTMVGTTATLQNVKQVTTGTFVVEAATDTFTHDEYFTDREGVIVYNDSGVAVAVGFNANIVVGGNGIQIADGGEESFPIADGIKVYAIGASGEVSILEYK